MAVTAPNRRAGLEIHAERRAEQRLLRVVHGQGIAREQDVHVAAPDQLDEVRAAAGVDDDGSGDEGNLQPTLTDVPHHRGDAADARFDAPLGGDLVRHEPEVGPGPVAELGPDADAFEAAHDAIAGADLAEFPAHRAARHQHDDGIHALTFDFDPGTADPDVGALVGRGVEVVRHAAVLLRHAHGGILHVDRMAAEWQELLEEILQRGSARRLHLQREPRELVVRATELEVLNLERAAALDDLVEDRLELLRVDEVAFSGDDGGVSVGHDGFGESTPSRPPQEEGRTGGTENLRR